MTNEQLFAYLCAGVASVLEAIKPAIKARFHVEDTANPWYVLAIYLIAALLGVAGAFALQINMVPNWHTPEYVGIAFTGLITAFGSELAHRLLEAARALSGTLQRQANKPTNFLG